MCVMAARSYSCEALTVPMCVMAARSYSCDALTVPMCVMAARSYSCDTLTVPMASVCFSYWRILYIYSLIRQNHHHYYHRHQCLQHYVSDPETCSDVIPTCNFSLPHSYVNKLCLCLYFCTLTNRKCVCVYSCNDSYRCALLCHVRLFPPCSQIPVSDVSGTAHISHSCSSTDVRIAKRLEYWIFVSFQTDSVVVVVSLISSISVATRCHRMPRKFLSVTRATKIVPRNKMWTFRHPKISG